MWRHMCIAKKRRRFHTVGSSGASMLKRSLMLHQAKIRRVHSVRLHDMSRQALCAKCMHVPATNSRESPTGGAVQLGTTEAN